MTVRKTDDFIADVERQYEWYLTEAGLEAGDRYLDTVRFFDRPQSFPEVQWVARGGSKPHRFYRVLEK